MHRWIGALFILFLVGCKEKPIDFSGEVPLKQKDFFGVFKAMNLPYAVSDTNIDKSADTITIGLKAFLQFFSNELANSQCVVDIGAGAGAATYYLASRNSSTNFIGVDHSKELIDSAEETSKEFNLTNLSFDTGDWFNLDKKWGGG